MTIDTLEYVKKLEAVGVTRAQAEAHAAASRNAIVSGLATKADLETLGRRLAARVTLISWMLGVNLAATLGVLWKLSR